MTNFHGFCSYPHGGWVMAGLIFSSMFALAATMWGVSSCRFVYLDFMSDRGGFEDFYLDPTPDGDPVMYRVGVGLFTWLKPFDGGASNSGGGPVDWSTGQCAGYTQLQMKFFDDHIFEVARVLGVFGVLGGIGVTVWTLFLACLSLVQLQIWLMSTVFFFLECSVGLTFLIFRSNLCQDLVAYQNDAFTTKCTLDQGGLVIIAACILWSVALLISVFYVKPPESDMRINRSGQITNAYDKRRSQRKQRKPATKKSNISDVRLAQEQQQRKVWKPKSPHSASQSKSPRSSKSKAQSPGSASIYLADNDGMEVQLNDHNSTRGGEF